MTASLIFYSQTHIYVFLLAFIIFAAITLLVHAILYIRLPSEILGYDLVIARIPTNISLNTLHDVLNDPLITVDKTITYNFYEHTPPTFEQSDLRKKPLPLYAKTLHN